MDLHIGDTPTAGEGPTRGFSLEGPASLGLFASGVEVTRLARMPLGTQMLDPSYAKCDHKVKDKLLDSKFGKGFALKNLVCEEKMKSYK